MGKVTNFLLIAITLLVWIVVLGWVVWDEPVVPVILSRAE